MLDAIYGPAAPFDSLIINGDLGNGKPQDYDVLKGILASFSKVKGPKLYYTIGNHEFYKSYYNTKTNRWSPSDFPNGETDQSAIKRFLAFAGKEKVYYDTYQKGFHFIFLGSEKSAISDKKYGDDAYLSQQQLNWLKGKLEENYTPQKPIFVFLHQPVYVKASGNPKNKYYMVIQHAELQKILRQYPEVILFNGHTHFQLGLEDMLIQDGCIMVNSSSVHEPLDKQNREVGYKSEGLVVQAYDDKVVIKGWDFIKKSWVDKSQYVVNLKDRNYFILPDTGKDEGGPDADLHNR